MKWAFRTRGGRTKKVRRLAGATGSARFGALSSSGQAVFGRSEYLRAVRSDLQGPLRRLTVNQPRPRPSRLRLHHQFSFRGLVLVEELERQCQDLVGVLVGLKITEFLLEVSQWHYCLGHGGRPTGAADFVEVLPYELTGVPRVSHA